MKIYTKQGDGGTTSLVGGTRISKAHIRIESYGNVDELNSCLGVVMGYIQDEEWLTYFTDIQNELFIIGSHLAAGKDNTYPLPEIKETFITELEASIDELDQLLPELKFFILPSGHPAVSHCHVARCVCRRAERVVVALDELEGVDKNIVKYLNRLSDFLFTFARYFAKVYMVEEVAWKTS